MGPPLRWENFHPHPNPSPSRGREQEFKGEGVIRKVAGNARPTFYPDPWHLEPDTWSGRSPLATGHWPLTTDNFFLKKLCLSLLIWYHLVVKRWGREASVSRPLLCRDGGGLEGGQPARTRSGSLGSFHKRRPSKFRSKEPSRRLSGKVAFPSTTWEREATRSKKRGGLRNLAQKIQLHRLESLCYRETPDGADE